MSRVVDCTIMARDVWSKALESSSQMLGGGGEIVRKIHVKSILWSKNLMIFITNTYFSRDITFRQRHLRIWLRKTTKCLIPFLIAPGISRNIRKVAHLHLCNHSHITYPCRTCDILIDIKSHWKGFIKCTIRGHALRYGQRHSHFTWI